MTTNDALHASIAAALVTVNVSFTSFLEAAPEGGAARTFRLPYVVRGQDCTLIGYVGGAVFIVVAAVRVECSREELTAKRHLMTDFLVKKSPLVRVLPPNEYQEPDADWNVVWIEAAVPIPLNGQAIDSWLALPPFVTVLGGVQALAAQYPEVHATNATSFPMMIAGSPSASAPSVPAPPR